MLHKENELDDSDCGREEMTTVKHLSFFDDDLYKYTMQQAVLALYPDATAQYVFINRGHQHFTEEFRARLQESINAMADLKADDKVLEWLKGFSFFKPWYIEYLRNYRYNPAEIYLKLLPDNNLDLRIKGTWRSTILWEVKLMSLISELYFILIENDWSVFDLTDKIVKKTGILSKLPAFADFGTRRRRSLSHHAWVIQKIRDMCPNFVGTSNVQMAWETKTKPIGTMAHEWIMGHSVLEGLRHANRFALDAWAKVYRGSLGIALSDTYGLDPFFADFDTYHAKLFDGIRHDSGDPFEFTRRCVQHYKNLGIDPMSKTLVFSDSLTPEKAVQIAKDCEGKIKCSFGIGTNLTNDITGSNPLNIVIKLRSINCMETVKLTDDPRKSLGSPEALRVANWTFNNGTQTC
jgi:nicotinate phosphoribosyltransferase